MSKIIGLRREDLSKIGEKRTPISPKVAQIILDAGIPFLVQPRKHPETGEIKRSIYDKRYTALGADLSEDLSKCDIIFGLKEIDLDKILANKCYLFFSHTHKGQIKNRKLLKQMVEKKATVIDYELITDIHHARLVTAFTYFAGYAGMIDSLWMLGKRLAMENISNPFDTMLQSKDFESLHDAREALKSAGETIAKTGTPAELPPFIFSFLGDGKTSIGAQKMMDLLPHERISMHEVKKVFQTGSRKKVYKVVLEIPDMYRPGPNAGEMKSVFPSLARIDQRDLYFKDPFLFESNLDTILPYTTLLMNCIIWSSAFPRTLSNELMQTVWKRHKTLQGIGDITCDPNGSIEFSEETWIDKPVFIHHPEKKANTLGFEGTGVAVMAIANLPCEFSSDASLQFSDELSPFIRVLLDSNLKGDFGHSLFSDELSRATILWKGEFTPRFKYMEAYLK